LRRRSDEAGGTPRERRYPNGEAMLWPGKRPRLVL